MARTRWGYPTPPPTFLYKRDSWGEGRQSHPGRAVSSRAARPEFLAGHLLSGHTHSHVGDPLSRLSMDPMTVTW